MKNDGHSLKQRKAMNMTLRNEALGGILGLVVLVGMPSVAAAQTSGEVAGGYQFMREDTLEENFPAGWFASGGGYLTDNIVIVGEVSGSQKSETEFGLTADVDVLSYLGGVRVRGGSGPVIPFAQVLVGGSTAEVSIGGFGADESESETAFTIQPGGGVDIPLNDRVSARAMFDYRRIFFEDEGTNQIRFAIGIVVGFGGN